MKKHLRPLLSLLLLTAILVLPFFVFAQTTGDSNPTLNMLTSVATGDGGYNKQSTLTTIVGLVIRTALSLLGIIFIILIILGGYNWMLAEGSEQKVEKAQNYIRRAIIGLIITLSAWAIWSFVLNNFILKS